MLWAVDTHRSTGPPSATAITYIDSGSLKHESLSYTFSLYISIMLSRAVERKRGPMKNVDLK